MSENTSSGEKGNVTCNWCGSWYTVKPCRVDESSFCSRECMGKWRSENVSGENHPNSNQKEFECVICGGVDTRAAYYVKKHNKIRCSDCKNKTYTKTGECETCGEEFQYYEGQGYDHKGRFCGNDCANIWKKGNFTGENHPRWAGGDEKYGDGWNEEKKNAVRQRDDHKCQHCGLTEEEHIEKFARRHAIHHIQKARTFEDDSKRNAKENLVTLCISPCHWVWEGMSPLRPQVE